MRQSLPSCRARSVLVVLVCVACAGLVAALTARARPAAPPVASAAIAQDRDAPPRVRVFHIVARKYSYSPSRIEVQQDDLVKITLETADIPHSFTLDDEAYRIAKRAAPGRPAVFEFRADKVGSFPFYCNLKLDDGCRAMKGTLVVRPKD